MSREKRESGQDPHFISINERPSYAEKVLWSLCHIANSCPVFSTSTVLEMRSQSVLSPYSREQVQLRVLSLVLPSVGGLESGQQRVRRFFRILQGAHRLGRQLNL